MANYRTVVPGVQNENDGTRINQQRGRGSSEMGGETSRTMVSGGDSPYNYGGQPEAGIGGKPVVGFLVSVSRIEEGEYWVVRQGRNVIGSGSECDIVLNEASVSRTHALLLIHRNPGDNKLNVGIMEGGSSNGIFVNDNYIGFNSCQCENYYKIKIGKYELLLLLFDPIEQGMKKADNFIPTGGGSFDYADRDAYHNDKTRI
jgi:hypothetical protein